MKFVSLYTAFVLMVYGIWLSFSLSISNFFGFVLSRNIKYSYDVFFSSALFVLCLPEGLTISIPFFCVTTIVYCFRESLWMSVDEGVCVCMSLRCPQFLVFSFVSLISCSSWVFQLVLGLKGIFHFCLRTTQHFYNINFFRVCVYLSVFYLLLIWYWVSNAKSSISSVLCVRFPAW